jgi:hypothetical protein
VLNLSATHGADGQPEAPAPRRRHRELVCAGAD